MGSALKVVISRSELIDMMQQTIDWSVLKQQEARRLRRKIDEAANLVVLAAPQALKRIARGGEHEKADM